MYMKAVTYPFFNIFFTNICTRARVKTKSTVAKFGEMSYCGVFEQ